MLEEYAIHGVLHATTERRTVMDLQPGRQDRTTYPIQDDVRLEVYWRNDRAGYGPAASVYAIIRKFCVWIVLARQKNTAEKVIATST